MRYDKEIVWFATGNSDKFREADAILEPFGIEVRRLKQSKVEIQDYRLETIAKFALIEAIQDRRKQIIVEDSGLFIRSLAGFPGPYSSFVYRTVGLGGILALMHGKASRRAYFKSTVAFGSARTRPRVFTGMVKGEIARKIIGTHGFGYDPIFVPVGHQKTFSEMGMTIKNQQSHRARAFRRFATWYMDSRSAGYGKRGSKRALK